MLPPAGVCVCLCVCVTGSESSEELAHIHLDSDACLLAVEDPAKPPSADGGPAKASKASKGSGVAVILAFRCGACVQVAVVVAVFEHGVMAACAVG